MPCSHEPVRDELVLDADELAPKAARRFVADAAAGCAAEVVADAQLLVSELVSNVVRHTRRKRLTVMAETTPDGVLRVEVRHGGKGFLPSLRRRAADRVSGWGLEIVDRVARAWGVANGNEATIWFEVAAQ